jgi:elongation factor Ts
MAEISASMVMKLRKMSGQGMMDCKKALTEADGDIDKAMEILRKKGLATLSKRAARETNEGLVVGKISEDGKSAAMATLCCETDFVSKSDDFVEAAGVLADYALACESEGGVESILESSLDGKKFGDVLTDLVSKTGEKTEVGDYVKYSLDGPGLINIYIHFNKKVGAMIEIEASDDNAANSEVLKEAANGVAMHIAAINPLALDKEGISSEVIEQEKAIYAEQVKDKPANIIEKIVEGKLKKFFAEKCLLVQPFVKDDSKTVGEVISAAGKEAGGEAKIKRFVRFGIG